MSIRGQPQLLKEGTQSLQGIDEAIMRNITAVKEFVQIIMTSLGPNGCNKMIINHAGKLFITSDAATMVQELEVDHPAPRLLIDAAKNQEQEIGDGTNFAMIFAGELLQEAGKLIKSGLHVSEIISGYKIAYAELEKILPTLVCHTVEDITNRDQLIEVINPVIASKQSGLEGILCPFVVDACLRVMPKDIRKFNVDNVRVVKLTGATISSSRLVNGFVLNRFPMGTIDSVVNAKIAMFGCSLQLDRGETKGAVVVNTAQEYMDFSEGEEQLIRKTILQMKDAGINVIITNGTVSDLALHFCEAFDIMVLKCPSKWDMRRVAKVVRANILSDLNIPTDAQCGYCTSVRVQDIGGRNVTVFEQDGTSGMASIVIRGSTEEILNDYSRAIDDGINVVKAITRDPGFLPGAGAVDMELSKLLTEIGEKTPGLAQYAISGFGKALQVIPRILSENSGMSSVEILSSLLAAHIRGETAVGIDIEEHGLVDVMEKRIFDHLLAKKWAFKFAVDAATTVLSVDQIIMARKSGGPRMRGPRARDAV
ncbi:hypothetical protein PCE1_003644 [Barthelona sp. PCE]